MKIEKKVTPVVIYSNSSSLYVICQCENLLSFTLPLSHYLQNPNRDISSVKNFAKKYKKIKIKILVK